MTNTMSIQILDKKQQFAAVYIDELANAVSEFPDQYNWPVSQVRAVAERMFTAMDKGTFNHDSIAYRRTAKVLGIKPTRKAILAFWNGQ